MTSDQEAQMRSLCKAHGITVKVDKSEGNCSITLEGDPDDVSATAAEIYSLMARIMKTALHEREKELFAKQAVWQYHKDDKFVKYDKETTALLEKAYHDKRPSVEWTDRHGKQKVDFKDMIQTASNGKTFTVRRYEHGKINLPPLWAPMNGAPFLAVTLATSSQEYKTVETSLMKTAAGGVTKIIKIERIQNPRLYKQFMNWKLDMDKAGGQQQTNERRLWHGTAGTNTGNINARNFNRNYGGQHGLAIGNGVYFATGSNYSIRGYCSPDASGNKCIYQARVLTGKYTTGQAGLREPPAGFNSVVDNVTSPSMFVVFYDAQTYPEYLVTFK
jgi:poly [ADP-ribose] polymerase 10/14/15